MRSALLIKSDTELPLAVEAWAKAEQLHLHNASIEDDNWAELLNEVSYILLLQPQKRLDTYVISQHLWWQHLQHQRPDVCFIILGFANLDHPCYLDLFRWESAIGSQWPTINKIESLPDLPGSNLSLKLKRFFDGHGDDSLIAVLTRLRRTVLMASRELREMQTPFAEIYAELIAPRQLDQKWKAWQNRWANYHAWFTGTPITNELKRISALSNTIEAWMLSGGNNEQPLHDNSVLDSLNAIREQLQHIEKLYVSQKLQHTHR